MGEDTRRDAYRFHSPVAQSVEQVTVNHRVAGSSPAGGAFIVSYYNTIQYGFTADQQYSFPHFRA
jgi:hypothetical protein